MSRGPRVSVLCTAVTIRLLLTLLKKVKEWFSLAQQHAPNLINTLFIERRVSAG